MKKTLVCLLLIILCVGCLGFGYILGGTNLGIMGYPGFSAYAPTKPYVQDELSASRYKSDVESYMEQAKKYVENAENDKKRIDSAIEDAVQKNNDAVEEYNRWVRTGY